jgi:uncharacterized damage-inducible protein DinB
MYSQATLTELLRGRGAHADPLACVSDVTVEHAAHRPQGHAFSIYQIVWHLNFWMDYERRKIDGENVSYPEHASLSWPSNEKPASASEWSETIGRFAKLIAQLERLSSASSDVLQQQVAPDQAGKAPSTAEARLLQTLAHNSYHVGQIVLLRRAMDIWPPPGGGDTW